MAIKKSQLYSTLWESCNALRGSMDASQYKDYVLMILFVKYLSDKATRGEQMLNIPDGCHFNDFVALKQNANIGEQINKRLEKLQQANAPFIGALALPNFNDKVKFGEGKQMVDTLSKLIAVFENDNLDFSKNRVADDDLLGDAYEYLMKNFAAESGKSKGQFYTPAEVSRVIAKVLHLNEFSNAKTTIYDPTCGSGSLLLRALSETAKGRASLYGQELDSTTSTLAQLNMLLHGINNAKIYGGKNTLNDPQNVEGGRLKTFDVCIANPPFSQKDWLGTTSGGADDMYKRWSPAKLPPQKCGDYAFLLHLIASMKVDSGRGACILPHGVLFRGNAEYEIRKEIIKSKVIRGIIGLPANIFFGTGIPASIIIIDKKNCNNSKGIFMIDAKDGFMKDGNKNRLREQDIRRIVDTWNAVEDIPHYARFVEWDEIEANDYNLNIPRYITPCDNEVRQNIEAHLNGGIPRYNVEQLSAYWEICYSLQDKLFAPINDNFYSLRPKKEDIGGVVLADESFKEQFDLFTEGLNRWIDKVKPEMLAIGLDSKPKNLIARWSDMLLFEVRNDHSLVPSYDVYDHLMNYWAETMQDDCYMISNDGWQLPEVKPAKKNGIYASIVCDLLPVNVILDEFFATETDEIAKVQATVDDIAQQMETIEEELAEDDEYRDDETYKKLVKQKKEKAKVLKGLQTELTDKVVDKYAALDEDEIRRLVVEKKWIASIVSRCNDEMNSLSQDISQSVATLAELYEHTLSELTANVSDLENKVAEHLKQMGF